MNSPRPYLLRAFYEWIVDNKYTPYILVDATFTGVMVPAASINNNKIVLNISMQAVNNLLLDNDTITFQARFSGRVEDLYIPIDAVQAIYAKENGRGMVFPDEGIDPPPPGSQMPFLSSNSEEDLDKDSGSSDSSGKGGKGKGHLRVIK